MPDNEISNTSQPGATAGDHLLSAAVPSAVAVAAAAPYPRLRAGLTSTAAPAHEARAAVGLARRY